MAARIPNSAWMTADTTKAALDKLSKMDVMVGHPDKWRDYLEAYDRRRSYGNVQRSNRFEWEYQLDLDKPVDHKKWAMTPQMDAYNGGLENKIVLSAGILQLPRSSIPQRIRR